MNSTSHTKPYRKRVSIRRFLSMSVIGIITLTITILGVLNYFQIQEQNEKLFRMQMQNNAHIIDSFISLSLYQSSALSELFKNASGFSIDDIRHRLSPKTAEFYNPDNDAFSFQVYNTQTKVVVLRSSNAPETPIYTQTIGFSQQEYTQDGKQHDWYAYTLNSRYEPYKIVIFVKSQFKKNTFLSLFVSSLWDLLILYVLITLLSLIFVRMAFRPLSQITKNLAKKDARKLQPLIVNKAPEEIIPLLEQLNILFDKFNQVLARERRFTADAAHELKTPLAVLKTQAEVALNTNDLSEIKKRIEHIITSTDQYFHIIDQLLTLSKLEPEQALPDREVFKLDDIIEHWIAQLAPKAINKNIEIEFFPSDKQIWLEGSSTFIGILVRNLVENAIQYTPVSGVITVKSNVNPSYAILEVIDTGPGVEKAKLNRIFDRFYRISGTNTKGSGLGLSIVKEIVRLHKGMISAESVAGKGLKIQVKLPYSKVTDR